MTSRVVSVRIKSWVGCQTTRGEMLMTWWWVWRERRSEGNKSSPGFGVWRRTTGRKTWILVCYDVNHKHKDHETETEEDDRDSSVPSLEFNDFLHKFFGVTSSISMKFGISITICAVDEGMTGATAIMALETLSRGWRMNGFIDKTKESIRTGFCATILKQEKLRSASWNTIKNIIRVSQGTYFFGP